MQIQKRHVAHEKGPQKRAWKALDIGGFVMIAEGRDQVAVQG
ncbi:hypothetical protein [Paenirhodobacter sp.]